MKSDFSLLMLFGGDDLMVLLASLLLVAGSIITWAIIVEKFRLFGAEKKTGMVMSMFRAEAEKTARELLRPNGVRVANSNASNVLEQLQTRLDMLQDKLIATFDNRLYFLSMASVVAPFVGLFGTIWGVMQTFASIGANQSTSLAVVAPGIAVALGTTALGLIVAIPAAVFYQYFVKRNDDLYNRIDVVKKDLMVKASIDIMNPGA